MKKQLTEKDIIFDGFMHRNFNTDRDGWRNEEPNLDNYPIVRSALNVIDLFEELCEAKKRIWELEQEVKSNKRYGL